MAKHDTTSVSHTSFGENLLLFARLRWPTNSGTGTVSLLIVFADIPVCRYQHAHQCSMENSIESRALARAGMLALLRAGSRRVNLARCSRRGANTPV